MIVKRVFLWLWVLASLSVFSGGISQAQEAVVPAPPDPTAYVWAEFLVDAFDNPLYLTHAGDGSGRLFIVEQTGYIWIVQAGEILFEPFLDISLLLTPDVFQGGYTERGLLGLVFHPQYVENGFFYIQYINQQSEIIVARYSVSSDPNLADPASETVLLRIPDPFVNHNGGQLKFGPDGYLYLGIGDGGDLGDPLGYGQNTGVFFGKILRLDVNSGDPYAVPADNPFVDNPDYLPEIWALGLRNPWRFSFDALTGDLYIGDVGEALWEEINFQEAGFPGGANYGWNAFEGNFPFNMETPVPRGMILPVVEYSHDVGCSVTGGYVYRGAALPALQGVYFFGDYCSGRVWATYRDADRRWQTTVFAETGRPISSFGLDEAGELYLVDYKGSVLRLAAAQ